MKLTTLDEDLRIHQKLEDEPNDVGGLSAQALKEKFDQAGVTIQKYLNETHLPEEEKAVEDALSEAKEYTDAKTKAVEQGNMKTAVYDTKKRRRDIFDYTDGKIEELQAKKFGGAWMCSGTCNVYVSVTGSTIASNFIEMTDPDGLWSQADKAFVVPEGGSFALLMVRMGCTRNSGTEARLHILVNGTVRTTRSIGQHNNGTWELETVLVPIPVGSGDKISLKIEAYRPADSTNVAQVQIREAGVIIFA